MTATYQIQRDELIKASMMVCQALGQGESPTSQDITDVLPFLNSLLKYWEVKGYNAWLFKTFSFPAVAGKTAYNIGTSAGADVVQDRPVRIPQAWTQDASGNRTPLTFLTRQQFELLTPPTSPGPSNSYLYDRQLDQGVFKPWPIPTDGTLTFYCLEQRPISDLAASSTATFDIEQSWNMPLIWAFAEQIMPMFGTEESQCRRIERNAQKFLDDVVGFTDEDGSVFFQPSPQGGIRGRG